MSLFHLDKASKKMKTVNEEISTVRLFNEECFEAGLISFRVVKSSDRKMILHEEKDVLCYVIAGNGVVKMGGRSHSLKPGTMCHIPAGTEHDFHASKEDLSIFYVLVKR